MKIGPLDVGIPSLAYLSTVAVLILVAFQLYISRSERRVEARLGQKIRVCLIENAEGARRDGTELCRQLIQASPSCAAARLYLGTFLYDQGKFAEARQAYEEAVAQAGGAAEVSACGFAGAAAAAFAQRPASERTQGAVEAEKLFRKALEADPENPDALAGQATVLLWKGGPQASVEAAGLCRQALSGKRVAGRLNSSRLYNAYGVALSQVGKIQEAEESFEAAAALDPAWRMPRENRALTVITNLGLPGMKLEERDRLIEKFKERVPAFAPHQAKALNALAIGLWWTKRERKASVYWEHSFPLAVKLLTQAIDQAPKEPMAFWNLVGLYEDRLFGEATQNGWDGIVAELPPGVLEPARSPPNPWRNQAPPTPPNLTEKAFVSVHEYAQAIVYVLTRLQKNIAQLDAPRKLDLQLHLFSSKNLLALVSSNPLEREQNQRDLVQLCEELETVGAENPVVLRALGLGRLRRGEYKAAYELLRKAREKGDGSAELDRLVESLARKPVFFDKRPRPGGGLIKRRPLVGASFMVPGNPGAPSATLTWDGRKHNEARLVGSQILVLPSADDFTDGVHRAELQVTDGAGITAVETLVIPVDKRPPTLKLDPEREVDGPRPIWTVALEDVGVGVDMGTVEVDFRSVGGGATFRHDLLVGKGLYQKDLPAIGVKQNDPLPAATFKVSSVVDLTPGSYALRISFADQAGNLGKVELRVYTVK